MRSLLLPVCIVLSLAVAVGCGIKDGQEDDADTGTDTADDTATDETTDTPADTSPDEGDDPVTDTTEDTVEDSAEDTSGDPVPDAEDVAEEDGSGDSPYIASSNKGTELPTACNPDGSTTEAIAASDAGGGCIWVNHYCHEMNCCTTLSPTLTYTPPLSVTITETETGTPCYCTNLFSPRYEVCGLTPGTWTITIGSLSTTVTVS